jgi:hypothetical protein
MAAELPLRSRLRPPRLPARPPPPTRPPQIVGRRPGDAVAVWAATGKAERLLGWRARLGVADMCRDQWAWASRYPRGFEGPEVPLAAGGPACGTGRGGAGQKEAAGDEAGPPRPAPEAAREPGPAAPAAACGGAGGMAAALGAVSPRQVAAGAGA